MLIPKNVICVKYVDYFHWFYRDQKILDKFPQSLQYDGYKYNCEMSVDSTVTEKLGVLIEEVKTDKVKLGYQLTQEGLIINILSITVMTYCNRKATQTSGEAPLGTNPDGDPYRYQTKRLYASVKVIMMYLASYSWQDILFVIHQYAFFTQNYQESHEDSILRICRYLKDTQKKGLILSPTGKIHVNCYVDSEFVGMFSYKDPHDPVCARSQSGYVVTFYNCPIMWVSKIQT